MAVALDPPHLTGLADMPLDVHQKILDHLGQRDTLRYAHTHKAAYMAYRTNQSMTGSIIWINVEKLPSLASVGHAPQDLVIVCDGIGTTVGINSLLKSIPSTAPFFESTERLLLSLVGCDKLQSDAIFKNLIPCFKRLSTYNVLQADLQCGDDTDGWPGPIPSTVKHWACDHQLSSFAPSISVLELLAFLPDGIVTASTSSLLSSLYPIASDPIKIHPELTSIQSRTGVVPGYWLLEAVCGSCPDLTSLSTSLYDTGHIATLLDLMPNLRSLYLDHSIYASGNVEAVFGNRSGLGRITTLKINSRLSLMRLIRYISAAFCNVTDLTLVSKDEHLYIDTVGIQDLLRLPLHSLNIKTPILAAAGIEFPAERKEIDVLNAHGNSVLWRLFAPRNVCIGFSSGKYNEFEPGALKAIDEVFGPANSNLPVTTTFKVGGANGMNKSVSRLFQVLAHRHPAVPQFKLAIIAGVAASDMFTMAGSNPPVSILPRGLHITDLHLPACGCFVFSHQLAGNGHVPIDNVIIDVNSFSMNETRNVSDAITATSRDIQTLARIKGISRFTVTTNNHLYAFAHAHTFALAISSVTSVPVTVVSGEFKYRM